LPGDQEVGAYYEAQLEDGSVVSGTAEGLEHAQYLIESIRQANVVTVYTCHNEQCNRAVAWSQSQKRWYHALVKDHPTPCPGLTDSTALPAPPKSRDRPYKRGLWANGG
jgi:hypothetical protein